MSNRVKQKPGKKNVVGAALIRSKIREKHARRAESKAFAEAERQDRLKYMEISTTEQNSLDDFLAQATLANRDFTAVKETKVMVIDSNGVTEITPGDGPSGVHSGPDAEKRKQLVQLLKEGGFRHIPIPKRPQWIPGETTKEELEVQENKSFLEWRRGIALMEEENSGLQVTPFEKNLQFWRQLWRVAERSDLVIQVVDSRNPLLFRCKDLEEWVKTLPGNKGNFLLLNKADFLTKELREKWAAYFQKEGIQFAFFSAKHEQSLIDEGIVNDDEREGDENDMSQLRTRRQLVKIFRYLLKGLGNYGSKDHVPTIGTVGYPNVGKSSVINVLCNSSNKDHNAQRVSVSATPGHTKHFQTLMVWNDEEDVKNKLPALVLCDCPGLVFPCFVGSKAEMLCFGILPIDEIRGRDWVRAIELVCDHVPKQQFEEVYAISLGSAWYGDSLLNILMSVTSGGKTHSTYSRAAKLIETYCMAKGLWAGGGSGARMDEGKAARIILKDTVSGKLVWCEQPPDVNGKLGNQSGKLSASAASSSSKSKTAKGSKQKDEGSVFHIFTPSVKDKNAKSSFIQGDGDDEEDKEEDNEEQEEDHDDNDDEDEEEENMESTEDDEHDQEEDEEQQQDDEESDELDQNQNQDQEEGNHDSKEEEEDLENQTEKKEEDQSKSQEKEIDADILDMLDFDESVPIAGISAGGKSVGASIGPNAGKSKRLLKHGRKHRKARDVEPYAVRPILGAVTVGVHGSKGFTRKQGPGT